MRLTQKRWLGIGLGVTIFGAAFGIAFAVVWYQSHLDVPSAVDVKGTIVVSGDQGLFMLWHDQGRTKPLITGDPPLLKYDVVRTKPPLRRIDRTFRIKPIWIENVSLWPARPVAPCDDILIGNLRSGHVSAELFLVKMDGQERRHEHRGNTCDDHWGRDGWMMPGELWQLWIHPGFDSALGLGFHDFVITVGGIAASGDQATLGPKTSEIQALQGGSQ